MRIFKFLGRDERGVTSIEYATIAGAIGLALMAALPLMRSAMTDIYDPLTASLDKFNQKITRRIAANENLPAAPRPGASRTARATSGARKPRETRPPQLRGGEQLEPIMTGSLRQAAGKNETASSMRPHKAMGTTARKMLHSTLSLRPSIYDD